MKKNNNLIMISMLLIGGLTSCGPNNDLSGSVTITDMLGREVAVNPGTYNKICCIGAGALRLYTYVGDVSLLGGVEDIDNYTLESRPKMFDQAARPYFLAHKEVFKDLPSCGVGGPNNQFAEAEKILACDADLVISEYEDATKANALQEQLGVPVITVSYGSKGVFDTRFASSINLLGEVLNKKEKATTLNTYIETNKNEIKNLVSTSTVASKSTYICGLGNWGTTNHLQTAQNYESFNIAGVTNVVTGLAKDGVQAIEEEKFVSLGNSMDVMFLDAAAIKNIKPLYQADNTLFDTCKAWQDGEVYLEMPYNVYYTNAEIALANTWYYASVLHSDVFENFDITTKLNEITNVFLGKELAAEIYACGTSYGGYQKINTSTFFN